MADLLILIQCDFVRCSFIVIIIVQYCYVFKHILITSVCTWISIEWASVSIFIQNIITSLFICARIFVLFYITHINIAYDAVHNMMCLSIRWWYCAIFCFVYSNLNWIVMKFSRSLFLYSAAFCKIVVLRSVSTCGYVFGLWWLTTESVRMHSVVIYVEHLFVRF